MKNFFAHLPANEDGTVSVPKRRHIKFRRRGIIQKKADICKFVTHYKNYIKLQTVRYATFFDARPANQPTVTGVSPCHRKVAGPFSNGYEISIKSSK